MQQGDARPGYARSLGKRLQCWLFVAVNYMTDDDLVHHRLRPRQALPRGAWEALAKCYWIALRRPTKPETLRRRFYDACRERRLAPWREWASPRLMMARHLMDYAAAWERGALGFLEPWLLAEASVADVRQLVPEYGAVFLKPPLLPREEYQMLREMLAGHLPPVRSLLPWLPSAGRRQKHLSWLLEVMRQQKRLKDGREKGFERLASRRRTGKG